MGVNKSQMRPETHGTDFLFSRRCGIANSLSWKEVALVRGLFDTGNARLERIARPVHDWL